MRRALQIHKYQNYFARSYLKSKNSIFLLTNGKFKSSEFFEPHRTLFNAQSLNNLQVPKCSFEPDKYEGATYETVKKSREENVIPSQKAYYQKPLLLHQGRSQWVWDHEGRRYLDMFGGIATISVGHCHPKLLSAMTKQAAKLGHTTAIYMHSPYYEYVGKLTTKLPKHLNCVYMVNSGSEATELAIQMARLYTGRQEIISLKNAYHGGSAVALATTAVAIYKYPIPPPPGHIHVTNPDVYKGEWGGSNCRDSPIQPRDRKCDCTKGTCMAENKYFEDFKNTYNYIIPADGRIAAFIAESIQGVGGTVQFPKNYLKRVYEFVRKRGGLCIADEVQTGFGRTGEHFWGFEGHGVEPDIVIMAKGIGNGYPMGAVVTRLEIAQAMSKAAYFNTFGGNPVACAVGSAVIDVINEEKLQENSLRVGTHILKELSNLMNEFPEIIGDVRGKGLMIGVELVSNPETKAALPNEQVTLIFEDMKNMGVLAGKGGTHGNVLRIKPPMCVKNEDGDFTVETLRIALKNYMGHRK